MPHGPVMLASIVVFLHCGLAMLGATGIFA